MSDEGPAHYFDMLDQLIEGHQFLRTTFRFQEAPHNSWSIDPFGHGSTFPYLLQKSGISNIYIQRTHFAWKRQLSEKSSLEFFWRQPTQKATNFWKNPLFCHMSPLELYTFKYACGPDIKTCLQFDFRKIFGESSESNAVPLNKTNIDSKAHQIVEQYSKLGSLFPHNVALVLLGDDFRYNFEIEWQQQYTNYNYLMNYINSNGDKFDNTEVSFGTLNDYFEAVNERMPIEQKNYPSLQGDFMPYADIYVNSEPNYWTGYYTSRPYYKSLSRELQFWLRSTEIIYSFSKNYVRSHLKSHLLNKILEKDYSLISNARQNLALFQHHDGITGTSKDFVMEDYGRRMGHSISNMMEVFSKSIQYLYLNQPYCQNNSELFLFSHLSKSNWRELTKKNILKIPADESGLKLIVFNSHLQWKTEAIAILVEDPFVKVVDIETGTNINIQINPVYNQTVPSSTIFEIMFIDTLAPMSLKNYKVLVNENNIDSKVKIVKLGKNHVKSDHSNEAFQVENSSVLFVENQELKVQFTPTGYIESVHFKKLNKRHDIEMSFVSYNSESQESGAYLFRPNRQNPLQKLFHLKTPTINLFQGPISSTVFVNFTDVSYSVTLYNSSSIIGTAIKLNLFVDLENKDYYNDQEIAIRIRTQISNNKKKEDKIYRTFFVDSNGFQMMERSFVEEVGVEGNYYPMTTAIYIEDKQTRFTILSSFSHGVTSPLDGAVEVMLDRRIVDDDKRGLSQGMLDNIPVESSFWLLFEHFDQTKLEEENNYAALTSLSDTLLLNLNYPSIVTYAYKSDREITMEDHGVFYRNHYFSPPNLLCQYFILNLRTLPEHNDFTHPSSSSLLILHNRAFTSKTLVPSKWYNQTKCDSSTKRPIRRLASLNLVSIEHTSLSGMHTLNQTLSSLAHISVSPSEIDSFNITFA